MQSQFCDRSNNHESKNTNTQLTFIKHYSMGNTKSSSRGRHVPVGTVVSNTSASSSSISSPPYQEYGDEARQSVASDRTIAHHRAAALEAKMSKSRPKSRAELQLARLRTAREIEEAIEKRKAPVSIDGADGNTQSKRIVGGIIQSSQSVKDNLTRAVDDNVLQHPAQYTHIDAQLLEEVRKMPYDTLSLLYKIIRNAYESPEPSTVTDTYALATDPVFSKYRRIRLANQSIQNNIVNVDGALELLMELGFVIVDLPSNTSLGDIEAFLYLPPHSNREVLRIAQAELTTLLEKTR